MAVGQSTDKSDELLVDGRMGMCVGGSVRLSKTQGYFQNYTSSNLSSVMPLL
jgi:hypothetical protein